jgi:anaerobic magnesium-protoporphyrin IX monomethyl ester cyclase
MILLAHSYFLAHDPKQAARRKPYPPLATLLAAATLRREGHAVALFDAMLASGLDAFRVALALHRPRRVAIIEDNFNFLTKMCTVRMREATIEMIASARAAGCEVVVNGSDATDHPALYLAAGAAAVIVGDAEPTLLAVAEAWRADGALGAIDGLVLAGEGAGDAIHTARRASLRDLDALPLPAWDLVDVDQYRAVWMGSHGRLSWNMVTSRGCPFGCNWCAKPLFGRRYTQRSPASVAEEMALLKQQVQPGHVWFADDIFGLTPAWIEEFAREVRRRDARIPFNIQCRADLMSEPVVRALADAGAEEVWMGVESGSQKILDAMDKGTTIDEIQRATRRLKAGGVRACWFLQLGYPSEDWGDVLMTRDFVRDEQPDDIGVSVAYPLPGTRFHAAVVAELGLQHNWEDTGDLAMLFRGTYDSAFYRTLRDALHDEARTRRPDHARWAELADAERVNRTMRTAMTATR